MARTRRDRTTEPQAPQVEQYEQPVEANTSTASTATTNTATTNTGERKMAGLTQEQIDLLLAGNRQRGQYTDILEKFLASGNNGSQVSVDYPELKDKKSATVKQGFENAISKKGAPAGADKVKVMKQGEEIFLINLAVVQGVDTDTEQSEAA